MTDDLATFMRCALSFIEDMLLEARDDLECQAVAISDISGHIRQIRRRLQEDEPLKASVMLAFDEITRNDWRRWWNDLGEMKREEFFPLAENMLQQIHYLNRCLPPEPSE
jgi:hypothetical protein